MTVSEFIFDFLQKKGLETVFMVSGSSAMWLTDSLKRNEKLKAVCCNHEQAAAMGAACYGRLAGVPGACLVTIGPGATNAITGVAGAYTDSFPMFCISGQANSKLLTMQRELNMRQNGTQCVDLEPVVSPIVKYFGLVMAPEEIRFHMEKAYWCAMEGRRGPVWIDVPIDIQNRQIPPVEEMPGFTPPEQADYDDFDAAEIIDKVKAAKKPLILAGFGVRSAGAAELLKEFSHKYQVPVVTSRGGIDVMESDDSLFIGRPGGYGDRPSHFAVQGCDLLLILGSRLSVSTIGYYPDRLAGGAYKLMVDVDKSELSRTAVPIHRKLYCDLKLFLSKLLAAETKNPVESRAAWLEWCDVNKAKHPVVQPEYRDESPLNAYYFTEMLTAAVPEKAAVIVDTGSVCNVVSQTWKVKPGQDYIISGGLSCMGFWAAAEGAAVLGRDTYALTGDGSAMMNIQEFSTLRHNALPVKVVIYNNHGYLLIRHNQHNYMNDRFLGVSPESGVGAVDFCAVASAFGLPSMRIELGDDIPAKLAEFVKIEGPAVLEVMTQEFGIMAPRIASKVMPDGSLKAAEFDDLWPFLEKEN